MNIKTVFFGLLLVLSTGFAFGMGGDVSRAAWLAGLKQRASEYENRRTDSELVNNLTGAIGFFAMIPLSHYLCEKFFTPTSKDKENKDQAKVKNNESKWKKTFARWD